MKKIIYENINLIFLIISLTSIIMVFFSKSLLKRMTLVFLAYINITLSMIIYGIFFEKSEVIEFAVSVSVMAIFVFAIGVGLVVNMSKKLAQNE